MYSTLLQEAHCSPLCDPFLNERWGDDLLRLYACHASGSFTCRRYVVALLFRYTLIVGALETRWELQAWRVANTHLVPPQAYETPCRKVYGSACFELLDPP